jgi:ketosteroid isomerase-like protein
MSQKNVELARDLFKLWRARNYDRFLLAAHPDVEIFSRFASVGGEPYRGPEGVRTWTAEIEQSFGKFEVRADDFRDLGGDRILALGAIDLEGRTSGIEIEQPMGWLFELRDGKLARIFFYSSHAEALEAVGLSDQAAHADS